MRCLLLLTTAWALAPISTPPKRTEFREGIGGATKEQAVAVGETVACAKQPIGPRDVVIRCYDISSDGKLAPALSLATSKRVHWFPKLTCAVGDRAWAYDPVHKLSCRGAHFDSGIMAASPQRNAFVKNYLAYPSYWLICAQVRWRDRTYQ